MLQWILEGANAEVYQEFSTRATRTIQIKLGKEIALKSWWGSKDFFLIATVHLGGLRSCLDKALENTQ